MNYRFFWYIGSIIFVIIASYFFIVFQNQSTQKLKHELVEVQKQPDNTETKKVDSNSRNATKTPASDASFHEQWHEDELIEIPQKNQDNGDIKNPKLIHTDIDLDQLRQKMITLDEKLLSVDYAKHQDRIKQHRKNYALWFKKVERVHNEWRQATTIQMKSPEEYIAEKKRISKLSSDEKHELMKEYQQKFQEVHLISKRLKTLLKDEPTLDIISN